jgi:hypothetical protein
MKEKLSGFTSTDHVLLAQTAQIYEIFGIQGGVLMGAVYINPRSSSCSEAEISQMFSLMQHDVSDSVFLNLCF